MNKVSTKQAAKNRELAKIKQAKLEQSNNRCVICGRYEKNLDLIHLLPRSLYPEYITESWNLECACRSCHNDYDNSAFCRRNSGLYDKIAKHDEKAAKKYFQLN